MPSPTKTTYTVQELENLALDHSVNPPIKRTGLMGKASDGSYYNISVNELTGDLGNNSSSLLSYNAAGEVVYADDIIGGVTYRTTFTRSDMTVTSTLAISAAVAQ